MEQKSYMWLSFRDPERNRNLGVAVISLVNSVDDASKKAWELNINPGGEVLGIPLTEEQFIQQGLEADKLYTHEQMIRKGFKKVLS